MKRFKDGEIVALDKDGNPDFSTLQSVLKRGHGTQGPSDKLAFFAFDLLEIDGADATTRLAEWVNGSRFRPLLRAILLDGITIAGLSVVDLPKLSDKTGLPVIAVTRKEPDPKDLSMALESAGFFERLESVRRAGQSGRFRDVSFSCAGIADSEVDRLLANQVGKSKMPECLRLAHLIAGGVTRGESRGR